MEAMIRSEATGPPLAGAPTPHALAGIWHWAAAEPDRRLLAHHDGEAFVEHRAGQVREGVRDLAAGLVARGVEPGDRVALLARTGVDWVYADAAILAAGAVSVPIYDTSSLQQIERILADSGAVLVLVETLEQRRALAGAAAALPAAPEVLAFEDGAATRLAEEGHGHRDEVEARVAALTGGDLAVLIYSSGTTGEPKGCELTHANLCANARQTAEQVPELFSAGARTLVFLPLAHALARIQLQTSLEQGVLTGLATSLERLPAEFAAFRPTFIVGVPRVFEKVKRNARARAAEAGRERVFDRAADVAVRWSEAKRGGGASWWLRAQHRLFDRLVFTRLREAFGGELELAICGGAALDPDLGRFFDGLGITVLPGYGLTEASPIVSGGPVDAVDYDAVGGVYPATTVRVADDGEILVAGPQVFAGYWRDPSATAALLEAGWLRTGDLGRLTPSGQVVITGRKKEILVTAGGKNVSPGPLADRVRAHPLVDHVVIVGEGRAFVGALVFLDHEELARRGIDPTPPLDEAPLRAELDVAVAAANEAVSRGEAIRAYRIIAAPLSIDAGELTPTQKLRRRPVEQRFGDEIEALYA
ncbi:MAG: long-chain fatty acid--CoA ligase [Egibacteraceae bacterium]